MPIRISWRSLSNRGDTTTLLKKPLSLRCSFRTSGYHAGFTHRCIRQRKLLTIENNAPAHPNSFQIIQNDDDRAKDWKANNPKPESSERQALINPAQRTESGYVGPNGEDPFDRVNHGNHCCLCCCSIGLWIPFWISACYCEWPKLNCWDKEIYECLNGNQQQQQQQQGYYRPPGQNS